MYKCKYCEKKFEKASSLGAHSKNAHFGGNVKEKVTIEKVCPSCNKIFTVERTYYKNKGKFFLFFRSCGIMDGALDYGSSFYEGSIPSTIILTDLKKDVIIGY